MRLAERTLPVAARRLTVVAVLALGLTACTTTTTTTELPSDSTVPTRSAPDPSDAERRARVRVELAAGYFARGQSEVALEEIRLALAAKPDFADAYTLRGLVYAGMGDIPKAEDSFREALRLNPRDADAMHNWGWVMCQQGRYAEADAMFERALAQPRYAAVPRTLLARGACQARDGKWADAERTLTRAYELDPANPATAFNLSEVLLRRGEYERARFYIGRVNAQPDQSNAQTLWLAARIEHRMGNADAVAMYGRQLKSRFPQSPEALAFDRGRFND
jgi:type IV pilus assembly protein PilF